MSRESRTGWKLMHLATITALLPDAKVYEKHVEDGMLRVIIGRESGMLHLSISYAGGMDRYPSWDEIVEARYEFMPNEMQVAMFLPPREEYVNLHESTFHLWEVTS